MVEEKVGNIPTIIALLQKEKHTPQSFIRALLLNKAKNNQAARTAFISQLPELLNIVKGQDAIKGWSTNRTTDLCCEELRVLRTVPAMRGDAAHLTVDKLEKFELGDMASDMTKHAPAIVHVITSLLEIKQINPNKGAYTDKSGQINEEKQMELEKKRADLHCMVRVQSPLPLVAY